MMKRNAIITILSVTVAVFCFHNIYQSWLIVHINGDRPRAAIRMSHSFGDGEELRAIRVIAGGFQSVGTGHDAHKLVDNKFSSHGLGDKLLVSGRNATPKQAERWSERNINDFQAGHALRDDSFLPESPKEKCHYNGSALRYKIVNGTKRLIPVWQRRLEQCGQLGRFVNGSWHFNLVELLQVRIYEHDKAKWTIKELKQWIHYMFLSGVEHIFICDHYMYDFEKLDIPLKRYIDMGLITYLPWSKTRSPMSAQVRCYQHIIDTYKQYTRWQMAIDMDEYPFALRDKREGFLTRYLRNMTRKYGARVTEISMSNYLMLGQGDRTRDIVISRINRMTPKPANVLVKPIYRPDRVRANIHHNHLIFGMHMNADNDVLRMLHYWGARVQDWGPDTPHTLAVTKEMNGMRDTWTEPVRNSLLVFGEYDAFDSSTGP